MPFPNRTYWSHGHRIKLTIWDLFDLKSPSIDFVLFGMFTMSVISVPTNDNSFIYHGGYPKYPNGRHKVETQADRGRMVLSAYDYKIY
jgi:hypothetical protein